MNTLVKQLFSNKAEIIHKKEFILYFETENEEVEDDSKEIQLVDFSSTSEYLAVVRMNIGINEMALGHYAKALENFDISEGIYESISLLYKKSKGEWDTAGLGKEESMLSFLQHYPGYVNCLNERAHSLHFLKQYEQAEVSYRHVLQMRAFVNGTHDTDYVSTMNSLAVMKLDIGAYDEAENLFKEALKLREDLFGREHPSCARILHNMSLVTAARRNYSWAGKLLEESIEINRKAFGKQSPEVALGLMNVEQLMISQGNENMTQEIKQYVDQDIKGVDSIKYIEY